MGKAGNVGVTTTLIVIQIIFGKPLRDKEQFQSNDVGEFLLLSDCSSANLQSALDRLVSLGWLTTDKATVSMQGTRGGTPIRKIYTRTAKGGAEYRQIVRQMKSYGIIFR